MERLRLRRDLAVALLVAGTPLVGSGCASGVPEPWQTMLGRDHPLTGRIWDVSALSFLDAPTLVGHLARGRFILLGEKHDNPDHHRLQARLLRALVAAGRRPAVGFEMFNTDDQPAIAQHLAATPTDAAGLARAVEWARRGWPDWALYQPIAEAALEAGLPIVATNLPGDTMRALRHDGVVTLDPALVARLGLDRPLAPDVHAEMAAEIRDSHCGYASGAVVETMVTVQRARDAQMAERLAAAADDEDGAVLIAGAGHVRNDRGIPMHLARKAPEAPVVSLAFLEVGRDRSDPAAYAERFGRASLPFDYVWFTPRLDDLDPCEKFEKQLRRLRKKR